MAPHPIWVGDLEWEDLLSGGMPVVAALLGLWFANVALTGWLPGMRILNRCGFKTEFSLWSCDLDRGHTGAHHLPWDPRLPADLTREEQEAFRGGLLEDILERPHRRRGR